MHASLKIGGLTAGLIAERLDNPDLGNEFEISNHENTTMTDKNESMVHMIGVMANFVQFWL